MKAVDTWQPSKFIVREGRLLPSHDTSELAVGSRVVAGAMARCYETAIRQHARGRLADLGCGKVPLFAIYREYVSDVVCIDWDNGLHGSSHVDISQDLNMPLQVASGSFDTVLMSDVLEHIRFPEILLKDVRRILASHGTLIMGVPYMYWLHEEPHDYFRYTRHALKSMAEYAGLAVVVIEETAGLPEVFVDLLGKASASRPKLQKAVLATAAWALERERVRRFSLETKAQFPLGYLMVAKRS